MKKLFFSILCVLAFAACNGKENKPQQSQLPSPVIVDAVQQNESVTVTLSWKAGSSQHKGFSLFVRDADNLTDIQKVGEVGPDADSFNFENLQMCRSYYLGVRADAEDPAYNSKTEYKVVYVNDPAPVITPKPVLKTIKAHPNCLEVSYSFANLDGAKKNAWGLCWSADGIPEIQDSHAHGPLVSRDDVPVSQLIPNAALEYGKEYNVRAYLTIGSKTYYSDETYTASLGQESGSIYLEWQKQSYSGLHRDIEVYACNTTLSGRPFMAWYAIADVGKGNVEFRTQVPDGLKTVDAQFGADCQVLTNAAYFYNGRNLGFSAVKGSKVGSISAVRGSLRTSDPEYNEMYNVTRGVFGVDQNQRASAYWGGTAQNGTTFFYDCPMASYKGSDKYAEPTASYPVEASDWNPYYAVTAGPVLVKNGNVVPDFTQSQSGNEYYISNYEVIPYDIYGVGVIPDRTAVGVTSDGKIILFVCDGRISKSQGATIVELARIMKGLGCIEAVNFDGGGSTAMVVMGSRVNSLESNTSGATENRPVASTMGFFVK